MFLESQKRQMVTSLQKFLKKKTKLTQMKDGFCWMQWIQDTPSMKNFFNFVLEDAKKQGKTLYIVISSNEYELVDGMNCLDVMEGKHVTFENYSDYKKIILHTRKKKNKRYKK